MTNYSYFRSADLSALLMLEQQLAVIDRRFLRQLGLSLASVLVGIMLLPQGAGLLLFLALILTLGGIGLGLWSGQRYYFEREYLWLEINQLAEPMTLR